MDEKQSFGRVEITQDGGNHPARIQNVEDAPGVLFTMEKDALKEFLASTFQGTWTGEGTDVFPAPGEPVKTQYVETMTLGAPFETVNPAGPGTSQTLVCVHYFTQLANKATGVPMHQETGFWLFDPQNGTFMKAISIPRGITILAGGTYSVLLLRGAPYQILMNASADQSVKTFGIANSPFLEDVAPTTRFTTRMSITETQFGYNEDSVLVIQGQPFNHTDTAKLTRQ